MGGAEPPLLYRENIAWMMDLFQPLFSVLVDWSTQLKMSLAPYVQTAIDLAEAADDTLRPKAVSALALICGEVFDRSEQYLGEDEFGLAMRKTLSLALLHLVKEADNHRSLMQLIESRVVIPAVNFTTANLPNSDLWVGTPGMSPFDLIDANIHFRDQPFSSSRQCLRRLLLAKFLKNLILVNSLTSPFASKSNSWASIPLSRTLNQLLNEGNLWSTKQYQPTLSKKYAVLLTCQSLKTSRL